MISKIVKNIFYVLYAILIMMVFAIAIIATAFWLAKSGELPIIALIVGFVIGFTVLLVLVIMTIKQLVEDCYDIDKMLKEIKDDKDKGFA